jgi:outer membrane receptor protein involved in Fe transport
MGISRKIPLLLASSAMASVLAVHGATAQSAAGGPLIEEVVVTATKQADSVNKVSLSVSAVTQKAMDQQGIRNVYDLSRSVPALTFRRTGSDGATNASIRGIFTTAGSPTTGVYLDDAPLQKRLAEGAVPGNGSPLPELFDLERVEVLRGPQGTLFGGSSLGGTIRFITPAPSLTTYSGYARAEASTTQNGDPSAEIGLAVGGPLIEDKLGFRASISASRVGGYIDHVNPLTRKTTDEDSNSENHRTMRLALRWQPTENLTISPSLYTSYVKLSDFDNFWENVPEYTVPAKSYGATGQPTTNPALIKYTNPAHTYAALDFYGPGKIGQPNRSPRINKMDVASLAFDYDFGFMTAKWSTSYIHDIGKGAFDQSVGEPSTLQGVHGGYLYQAPDFFGTFRYSNKRSGVTSELRFASPANQQPFSWVAGVYYASFDTTVHSEIAEDLDLLTRILRGVPASVYYGSPALSNGLAFVRDQQLKDVSLAAFGEANYFITDKLKVTAGLRISKEKFEYDTVAYGQLNGYLTPTVANGGVTQGKLNERPITPKIGVSYQMDEGKLLYATIAKGFRAGGVNSTIPAVPCSAGIAALGGPAPTTYDSDGVTSYEGGAKLRLFGGRAQVNSSIFHIDWSDIQLRSSVPGCPFTFVSNAGKAVSRGFDLQAQVKLENGLSANLGVGYTDARYTETTLGPPQPTPATPRAIIVREGDELPIAPWSVNLGLQYDFLLADRFNAYVRGDYQYTSPYHRSLGPGVTGYTPDTYRADSTEIVNARLGVAWDRFDLSLFANNLLNSQDRLNVGGGRSGCTNFECTGFRLQNYLQASTTFRPRTVGLTLTYRY